QYPRLQLGSFSFNLRQTELRLQPPHYKRLKAFIQLEELITDRSSLVFQEAAAPISRKLIEILKGLHYRRRPLARYEQYRERRLYNVGAIGHAPEHDERFYPRVERSRLHTVLDAYRRCDQRQPVGIHALLSCQKVQSCFGVQVCFIAFFERQVEISAFAFA